MRRARGTGWLTGWVLAMIMLVPAWANYEAGQEAWDAGHPGEALTEWQTAAEAGDRRAMLALGRLFAKGLGAPQDYVEAHKWFNLAASRGEEAAVEERDALTARMTPDQVAEAQARARAWQPGGSRTKETVNAPSESPPPRAIREAQTLLAKLGYDPGPADGVWSERVVRAYQSFLRDAGRPSGEALTPDDLQALRDVAQARGVQSGGKAAASKPRPDALHEAAKAGNLEGLKDALAAGADVNARDGQGRTALMHAVNKGYILLVEPMLAAKANPNLRAPEGATALFMAAAHGHTEIIVLLMMAGADPTITGPKGKTAVDVARTRYGDVEAARQKDADPAVLALLAGKTWAEVKADEDDAAFARADSAITAAAYAEYLAAFPQGRHADEAQRKVEELESLLRKWPVGKKFRDCDACPEMVVVPAGSFMMGSEKGDSDEKPVHRVTFGRPFAVGVYEVTRGEFGRFVEETGHSTGDKCRTYESEEGFFVDGDPEWKERSGRGWKNPGFEQGETEPVVCVNWADAQAYVRWLSEETGEAYRLLSEAEWEYVARAGTRTARYWGEREAGQCRYANGTDRTAKRYNAGWTVAECDDGHYRTAPVGSYEANGFGLHDVLGNVWEWTGDCWNADYQGAPADGGAWERGDCDVRVLRGGSWVNGPRGLRSAHRLRNTAGVRSYYGGFRLARTLTP